MISNIGIFALSLAAIFGTARAAAETSPPALIGKLAQKEIVFQFLSEADIKSQEETYGKEQQAKYFYRSFGRIIPLIKTEDGWLAECKADFHNMDCAKPTGYWLLPAGSANDGKTDFTAQWKAARNAPAIEVRLTAAAPLDSDSKLETWSQLLGTGATKLVPRPKQNSVVVGILTDTRSKVRVPQLMSGYADEVMERFNKKMKSLLVHGAAAVLENLSLDGADEDSDDIQFQSARWLVWGGGGGGYYGGSYSLFAYAFQVFDIETGDPVDARTTLFQHLSNKTIERYLGKESSEALIPRKWLNSQRVIESLVLKEAGKIDSKSKPDTAQTPYQIQNACVEYWIDKLSLPWESIEDGSLMAKKSWSHALGAEYEFSFELMPRFNGLAVVSNDFPDGSSGCRGIMFTIPWSKARPFLKQPLE